ncbi:S28 family serine protease [Streptomyces marincola]|uniref:S28 family serine protease n=1 Tax=Streptomyces marincola TaxID=2878388 RepID=UPI001CF2478E|nr:S28 family serine protease [Streptomyces marincola]UCM91069.1 aminopeptidase [Streptomyces marincola]
MRHRKRCLATAVAIAGASAFVGGPALADTGPDAADIRDRVLAVPGISLIEEKPAENGDRFFLLEFTQPVDHRDPGGETFQQRVSLLHTDEERPTVFWTGGYWINTQPAYSEPTRLLDGNEVGMEHRFFMESVPSEDDWSTLDIWQAASDQHRVHEALDDIYAEEWIASGRSKGGMMATYYRYYYPQDTAGAVAYVAPSNTNRDDTRAYDDFLNTVGTPECRAALEDLEREALLRRDEMVGLHTAWAEENGATFETVGSADASFESGPAMLRWAFWQTATTADCADIPETTASTQEIYDYLAATTGFGSDQELSASAPYYYQAATQLGNPVYSIDHIDDLVRYPEQLYSAAFVPDHIELPEFDNREIISIDRWVRAKGSHLLFVNGENDPWGAKPFTVGPGDRDAYVLTAPDANHVQTSIGALAPDDRELATGELREWAGLGAEG